MRVVLDARPLSHPQVGGFRSYLRSLVQGLGEIGASDEVLLYLDRPLGPTAPPLPPHLKVRVLGQSRLRGDFLQFRKQVKRDRPDLVHGTMNYVPPRLGVPTTITIHDALEVKRYPFVPPPASRRAWLMRAYSAAMTRAGAKKARRIITVSAASANELRGALGRQRLPIRVVHNGLSLPVVTAEGPRSSDTVLALASTDPRKNFDLLFRALAGEMRHVSAAPRLEIVCTNATAAAHVEQAARSYQIRNLCVLRSLSDGEMAAHYASAAVFVWPSRMEGFGLPPLEAMAQGCPVASSSAPSMPEVLGDVPLWFDPDRPEQLADAMIRFLENPALRQAAGQKGKAHAAQFTCRRMAEETRAVWQSALSGDRA